MGVPVEREAPLFHEAFYHVAFERTTWKMYRSLKQGGSRTLKNICILVEIGSW
jgi:hypothetical protein